MFILFIWLPYEDAWARTHARIHIYICTTCGRVQRRVRVSCAKKRKRKKMHTQRRTYLWWTKLENVRHGKGELWPRFPSIVLGPSFLLPSVRMTWHFLGHGPATLNSSLDVIIHIHIYLYFYRHVVCMYICIHFPRSFYSFLVPWHPPIVFLFFLSLSLSFSLART